MTAPVPLADPLAGSAALSAPAGVQTTFDELGTPLSEITFVVVDLETTGGSPHTCHITEIGAVKTRGGEVVGEFHSLVNPGEPIPAFIAVLTGITDDLVATAPRITSILPAFLEFLRGCVLVAHNAPFDVGFLKVACQAHNLPWVNAGVLDTARLARRTLDRDEAPNCKLSTLARLFHARTTPTHRALDDARATVDVLHGLFERLGCFGVTTFEEVDTFSRRVSPAQQRKRYLADGVPRGPGVYLFRDGQERVLYIGKSVDMRARVKQYFTASESRRRMAEMVAIAEEVVAIPCTTLLEAEVRELRLIAEYKPPYNRRSRFPEKSLYLKLTIEPFPRLSVVRSVKNDDTTYLGPFGSAKQAAAAAAAIHEAFPIRQCTPRLNTQGSGSACMLAEISRCGAPCEGHETAQHYRTHVDGAVVAITADARPVVEALVSRMRPLVEAERFEDAAVHRDRLRTFLAGCARAQRLLSLARSRQIVAARPDGGGGWECVVIRHGRLAAAGRAVRGVAVVPYTQTLVSSAEPVRSAPGGFPAASSEEAETLLRWLDATGVRLIEVDGCWSTPRYGAAGLESVRVPMLPGGAP